MKIVGIDLGTTYSAVSVVDENGKPKILDNQDGEKITPSVVLFQNFGDGDEPLVGTQAKNQVALAPDDLVQFVKRYIGDPSWKFDSSSGHSYSAEEISAIILKRLKLGAEVALGEEVTHAVITVPAYFDDPRRVATKNAGEMAGLKVVRVLNEPTAAALAYGVDSSVDGTFLVYDLGGGTFDATLMKISDDNFEVLATDGDRNLGGFDFDNKIISLVMENLEENNIDTDELDQSVLELIREKSEQAKRALSSVPTTYIHITINQKPYKIEITREQFEEATDSLLTRTIEISEDVLDDAGVKWDDINNIIMVGGSSRMPMVRQRLEEISGKEIKHEINPDEAVAMGAAVQAAIEKAKMEGNNGSSNGNVSGEIDSVSNINIEDVTSQSLGIVAINTQTNEPFNSIIIKRNTKIPASASNYYTTRSATDNILIEINEGDDEDIEYVTKLGETVVNFGKVLEAKHPIVVKLSYDIDQTIFGEVFDGENNELLKEFEIHRDNNLTKEQLEKSQEIIEDLKIF